MPGFGGGGFGEGGFGGYPLSLPSGHKTLQRIKITAWTSTSMSVSPYTGQQQIYQWPGEGWALEAALPPLKMADAEEWVSSLILLRGRAGTFLAGDTARKTPRGIATGTPVTNGTGNVAGAGLLVTDGWTHNITGILKRGDYLQVGNRLYKTLIDADSDNSGNASLVIFPRLRETVADNTAIITASACGTFRLADNKTVWDIDAAKIYGISFNAIEAI